MKIIAKNYRCFSENNPLVLNLERGDVIGIVGPNNSGKSWVLKFFYELRHLFETLANKDNFFIDETSVASKKANFNLPIESKHPSNLFNRYSSKGIDIVLEDGDYQLRIGIEHGTTNFYAEAWYKNKNVADNYEKVIKGGELFLQDAGGNTVGNFGKLRRYAGMISRTIYFPAFRNLINVGSTDSYYDISSGTQLVKEVHSRLTSDNATIKKFTKEATKDVGDIFGYPRLGISPTADGKSVELDIGDQSYKIEELGAGIAQFIMVFLSAAIRSPKPSFILIDEPELNLHPKLQIEFVHRLLKYTDEGLIFSTHSLGLARSVCSDTVYSIQQKGNESVISKLPDFDNYKELLGEMSFSSYPDLGFSKLLLVEGSDDLKIFNILLQAWGMYQDVLLWPLGGSAVIKPDPTAELEIFDRLEGVKKYCWIDSDRGEAKEAIKKVKEDFINACTKKNIYVHPSDRREIENYLPESAIEKVNKETNKTLSVLGEYDEAPPSLKRAGWQVASHMEKTDKDFQKTDLYKFLEDIKNNKHPLLKKVEKK